VVHENFALGYTRLEEERLLPDVEEHGGHESAPSYLDVEFGQVVARAAANSVDLGGLTRPLLEALAKLAELESTYLMTFDWDRREQQVRFLHSVGGVQVTEGMKIAIPDGLSPEALPGVTRSPNELPKTHPDSKVARRLGLKCYVSVPVVVAKHQLFGMLCGASQEPREVSERVIAVMEFFAQIIADHVMRAEAAATEERVAVAEGQLRARARFLAIAEHKLKTPLTALEGMPETLLDHWTVIPEDQRVDFLTAIVRNAKEMHRLIDHLLLEARAEVQARELAPVPVELAPLVRRVAQAFGSVSPSHEVRADAPDGLVIEVDPAALYQILGHLLDNAIKYSPAGGMIELRIRKTDHEVRFDVVDQGVGTPEYIDIFEPFSRGTEDAATEKSGVGLGLHIVRNLVTAMGGSVVGRRNPDLGSTFTVRVPSTA
jgi:signal transduction histidine kinase